VDDVGIFSETEKLLIGIWHLVLDSESIKLDDEFLDIGGDSLSAIRCISRVRKVFGVELTMEDFLWAQQQCAQ
jgi:acyl carrier protein